jgi:hypothetical protein
MAKIDVSKLLPQANKTAGIVKRTTTFDPKKYTPITKSLSPTQRDNSDTDKDDIDEVHVKEVNRVEGLVGNISNLLMSSETFKARRAERERKLLVSADRQNKEAELEADKAESKFNGPKLLRKVVGGNIIDAIYRFFLYTFLGAIFNSTKDIIPPLIKTFGKVLDPIAKIFTSLVGFLFEGFVFFVDLGFKVHDTIRGTARFLGGDFGVKIFDSFTGGLTTFLNTALIVGMLLASAGMMPDFGLGGGGKGKRGAAPGSRPGTRPPAPGARPGARPPAPGARPSRPGGPAARPGAPQVRPPAPGMPRGGVARGIGGGVATAAGSGARRTVAKGASRVGSKFVPFIGPLIDFAIRVLVFGDSPGRAAAGAVGVAAGQALGGWLGGIIGVAAGSVVPLIGNLLAGGAGALIGSVIGGFVGDALGTTLYDMLIEKTQNKPQKKATGGKISPTPARSTTKTVTRRRRLKVNSKTQQKQRTEPGKDIGGKNIIQRLFPDTDSPDGSGEAGAGGVLGWAKRILGMDEQSKEKGKRGNPYKALTDTSDILKKIPVVGGIMGASIDIALGQKPHDMVYNQLGESIAAIIQSAGERSSAEALRQIVAAYASGGVVTDSIKGTDTSSLGESLGKAFKHAIGIESAIAIRNIQTESSKKGVRSGAERTGEWEGSRGAPGLDEGDVGKPKPGGGGQGGARGGGSSPGSIQPTQPKAPGVPGAAPAPAPASGGGGGGGNVNVTMTQNQKKALDILSKYESASSGGYNAVNQIGVAGGRGVKGFAGDFRKMDQHGGRALTDMTIAEIMALQAPSSMSDAEWIKRGRLHAVGRYQFIGGTLPGVVQRAGIPKDAKFTKEVQDLLALQYMKEAGIGAWIGPADNATAEERRIIEAARKDPIKFSRAQGKAGAPVVASKPPGKPLGSIMQHLHGDPNRPGYDYSGHGTQGNAHDHFSFSNRETAIAAYKALKAAGYDVTEFEGYGRVGDHSARGGHFGRHGHDPTYEDASDGVAFDVPWYQFGSGAIGKNDYEKSRAVERIVKQAIAGQITSADGSTKVWDSKTKTWVAGTPGTSPASTAQRKVGQSAVLNGKPVVWDGSKWSPKRDASGNILSKISEFFAPKAAAAQGPGSPGYGGGGQGSKPTGSTASRGGPSTPARTQAARAAVRPTPKPAPKPAAKPAPKRAWYDPRGWVGKEEGGRIAPTPSRNDFDSLKSKASYEKADSQVMIQPIIIDNFIPMQMPSGTTSFGHGAARGAGGAGLNKTYKRNSLSRH